MRSKILNAKYSNYKGYYFEKKIPININEENYLENAVPFRFGFVKEDEKGEFLVTNIRTYGSSFLIQTFKDIEFKVGDRIMFDGKVYDIEDVSINYGKSTRRVVKQYFIKLK